MKILAVILILAAVALLGFAGLRTYGLAQHNRRRRRRRKAPRRLDSLTLLFYTFGAVFLAAGILIALLNRAPAAPAETTPSETQGNYGWQERDGVRYYINPDGTHALGWLDVEGSRYYIADDGVMVTGWQDIGGSRYYFDENGVMATGRTDIGGETWFFSSEGAQFYLVNPWNPVPAGYTPNLVTMDEYYATEGLQIDSACYDALKEMIDACNENSGARAYVLSAYRSEATQQRLYDRKVQEYLDLQWSRAGAEKEAAKTVALPGTSEHHLGLAVDIIDTRRWSLDEGQADMPAQKWLMEHCWEYGFIFRYPQDKQAVTGIIYEPWHYRYVGKELAQELHEQDMTLEEYVDSLT